MRDLVHCGLILKHELTRRTGIVLCQLNQSSLLSSLLFFVNCLFHCSCSPALNFPCLFVLSFVHSFVTFAPSLPPSLSLSLSPSLPLSFSLSLSSCSFFTIYDLIYHSLGIRYKEYNPCAPPPPPRGGGGGGVSDRCTQTTYSRKSSQ